MDTDLFDELENFGKPTPKKPTIKPAVVAKASAMDKLLKEASEYDRESSRKVASQRSRDAGDFNESFLDKPTTKVNEVVEPEKPVEPIGFIENPNGKP